MQGLIRLAMGFVFVFAAIPAYAQVRCTMPNGVVMVQRLATTCPQGATKAEAADGSPAQIRGPVLAPQEPIRVGRGGKSIQTVSKAEFGATWPLDVDSVELRCLLPDPSRPALTALVFAHSGQIYALNGTARNWASRMGWLEMNGLWRKNPAIAGTKIPIGPLMDRAARLCS